MRLLFSFCLSHLFLVRNPPNIGNEQNSWHLLWLSSISPYDDQDEADYAAAAICCWVYYWCHGPTVIHQDPHYGYKYHNHRDRRRKPRTIMEMLQLAPSQHQTVHFPISLSIFGIFILSFFWDKCKKCNPRTICQGGRLFLTRIHLAQSEPFQR